MSDTSKPESPRPSKVIRGGSTEFRQTDKRSSRSESVLTLVILSGLKYWTNKPLKFPRIRRDAASIDPETSPRQNAPSTRSRRRCELPRYDVRNIIVNKRDARRKRKDSVSQSKSRYALILTLRVTVGRVFLEMKTIIVIKVAVT